MLSRGCRRNVPGGASRLNIGDLDRLPRGRGNEEAPMSATTPTSETCESWKAMAARLSVVRLPVRAGSSSVGRHCILSAGRVQSRTLFSWFKSKPEPEKSKSKDAGPVLAQDDLFHHFSKSPFPAINARGEAIQKLAPCPVCASSHHHLHGHGSQPKAVKFECPDCGWPTHCSEEHWAADEEHKKYCSRLREVNEDDHDLRSGRRLREFELPGECIQPYWMWSVTHVYGRQTGLRVRDLLWQLGRVLVHAWLPVHGYGTFPEACEQAAHISFDYWFGAPPAQWTDVEQSEGHTGREQIISR